MAEDKPEKKEDEKKEEKREEYKEHKKDEKHEVRKEESKKEEKKKELRANKEKEDKFVASVVSQLKNFKKAGNFEKYYSWLDFYEEKHPEWYGKISKNLNESFEKEFEEIAEEVEDETEEIENVEREETIHKVMDFSSIKELLSNVKDVFSRKGKKMLLIPAGVVIGLFVVYLIMILMPNYGPLLVGNIESASLVEAYRAGATDWIAKYTEGATVTQVDVKMAGPEHLMEAARYYYQPQQISFVYIENNKLINSGGKYIWRYGGYTFIVTGSSSAVLNAYAKYYPPEDISLIICNENSECGDLFECVQGVCSGLECGENQKVEAHRCVYLSCWSDDMCDDDAACINDACTKLSCETCQQVVAHSCVSYECCSNSDCDDGYFCENHSCEQYECITDVDCDTGKFCSENRCMECNSTNNCECIIHTDCYYSCISRTFSWHDCVDYKCGPRQDRNVDCCGDYDCNANMICNMDSHLCI